MSQGHNVTKKKTPSHGYMITPSQIIIRITVSFKLLLDQNKI